MQITLDDQETKALIMALTGVIDDLSVTLAQTRGDELKYARLAKERAYLIALRLRIYNSGRDDAA